MNNFINNEYLSVVGGSLEAEMYCLDNQRRTFKNYSWEGGGLGPNYHIWAYSYF